MTVFVKQSSRPVIASLIVRLARAQQHVMISNAVTVGATVLNNNSATYASFAILMDQTLARQVRRWLHHCWPLLV